MDKLKIEADNEQQGLAIFDINGKKVYNSREQFLKKEVNITGFPEGIYVVHIENEYGGESRKIIKAS